MSIYKPFICSYLIYRVHFSCSLVLNDSIPTFWCPLPVGITHHLCFVLPHCRCMSMPQKSMSSTDTKVPPKTSDSACGLLGAYGSESEVNTGWWACFMDLLTSTWFFVILYSSIQWSAKSVYGVLDFSGTCAENILPVVCLKHGHGSIAKKGTCFGIRCEASWFSRFCRTSWKFTILPVLIHSSLQRRRKMKGDSQADTFPAFQVAF